MKTKLRKGPEVCFYGDDFTGATANLAGFHRAGLAAMLFLDTPSDDQIRRHAAELDVLGVAGTGRSLPPAEMRAEIEPALSRFREIGSRIVQYKICSTFDSSPEVGSFGTVLDSARSIFGDRPIPVFAACPDFGRYTVFGNHFAAYRGDAFRLDRHPVMSRHPATPMHEADLRLHLGAQTAMPVGLIDLRTVRSGKEALRLAFERMPAGTAVVIDAFDEADVDAVSTLLWSLSGERTVFTLAAQGLAGGLGRLMARTSGRVLGPPQPPAGAVDRILVLSGSASPQTATQIGLALEAGWKGLRLDLRELLESAETRERLFHTLSDRLCSLLARERGAILYTALGPDDPAIARGRDLAARRGGDSDPLVAEIGNFYGRLASTVSERLGLRRIVLAGGDTSSLAMRRIDAYALQVAGTQPAGGSISRLRSENPKINGLEVLLKAGQSGSDDVLLRALSGEGWI